MAEWKKIVLAVAVILAAAVCVGIFGVQSAEDGPVEPEAEPVGISYAATAALPFDPALAEGPFSVVVPDGQEEEAGEILYVVTADMPQAYAAALYNRHDPHGSMSADGPLDEASMTFGAPMIQFCPDSSAEDFKTENEEQFSVPVLLYGKIDHFYFLSGSYETVIAKSSGNGAALSALAAKTSPETPLLWVQDPDSGFSYGVIGDTAYVVDQNYENAAVPETISGIDLGDRALKTVGIPLRSP